MRSKSDRLETLKLKAALISYFRFEKQHDIVCTEFDFGRADVLSLSNSGETIYEVEVKVSLADLKRETKKYKHIRDHHDVADSKPYRFFYLAVPESIQDKAIEFCQTNFPYAGLYILRDGDYSSYGATGITTVIKAKPLKLPPGFCLDLEERAIKGMANNLASTYSKLVDAEKRLLPIKMF